MAIIHDLDPLGVPGECTGVHILRHMFCSHLGLRLGERRLAGYQGRFLMIKPGGSDQAGAAPSLVIVQNWTEELKRLVPTN